MSRHQTLTEAAHPNLRCPTCGGAKYLRDGYEDTVEGCDILQYRYVPCEQCNATGIYVSRAMAGLAE